MRTGIILTATVAVVSSFSSSGDTLVIETSRSWNFSDAGMNNGFSSLSSQLVDRDDDVLLDNGKDPAMHELTVVRIGLAQDIVISNYVVDGGGVQVVTFFTAMSFTDSAGTGTGIGVNTAAFTTTGSAMTIDDWNALSIMLDPSIYDGTGTVSVTPQIDSNLNGASGGLALFNGEFRVQYTWEVIPSPGTMAMLGMMGVMGSRRRR
ncbi:MAG: hypothetical protein ACF8GE_00710 [Phycisphaerales bacterium JB043]